MTPTKRNNSPVAGIVAAAFLIIFSLHINWLMGLKPGDLTMVGDLGAVIGFGSIIALFVELRIALAAAAVLFSDEKEAA